ncbi:MULTISPECIES: DUF421 domain-containing protein [Micromonospora]|uniref:DUF421 domain-containing protein n=1 Tax=Micromonospora solifontis TaxID=2487138 RepID=A0ABX9W9G1_9ACTN|nr:MULTISPECIES: YetF domain-containing protein [Micromonospora]NES16924.1 DUF421 domain-containing protein [Micromonospora sp. PPF5-17B]NES39337.1 DUF421 domain-containing protein [Micromonospora solifontis]NES58600.1 DUF421 domain-containing protein [Micromonospora sp. PPF5-6]RNL89434.1 DUF421 domain-containing protein [Micromonospora solifontis]
MNAVTALIGPLDWLGWVALKAFLLYVTAVIGLRAGGRRSLAELSAYDFVAAVAVGAIVGRLPSARDASYLSGVATLLAILAGHALITWVRLRPAGRRLIEKGPVVVVSQGRVLTGNLHRSGLTRTDLDGLLREHGVADAAVVHLAVLEGRGRLSVLRREECG